MLKLPFDYLTLGLLIFLFYWITVSVLKQKGILARYDISAFGPVLMIRTSKGSRFFRKLAKLKGFWKSFASVGSVFMLVSMVFMLLLVIYSNYVMLVEKPELTELHEPRNWLLIPGINEFIPICGWIGFFIAVIVHELSHGVLGVVERLRVKSTGLLVALVPIGGFAEIDNTQLFRIGARERTRILSAGMMSNFFTAFIAFLLFFSILGCIQPVSDKTLFVYDVAEGSLAERAGIKAGTFITEVDRARVTSIEEVNKAIENRDEIFLTLTVLDEKGEEGEIVVSGANMRKGVAIVGVEEGLPADNAGIKEGMSIIRINNKEIEDFRDFRDFVNLTSPGEVIELHTEAGVFPVKLTRSPYGESGLLGVSVANSPLGIIAGAFYVNEYLLYLQSIPSSLISLKGWITLMVIPFYPIPLGFGGFNPLLSHLYEPIGLASSLGLGEAVFYLADVLFWIGWINFYAGLFNCLPAIPFDGGYVFRDAIKAVLKMAVREEKEERLSKAISVGITIFIFFSIFFTLIAPYVYVMHGG